MIACPDYITHYYEAARGPFRNLSDLTASEADYILDALRRQGDVLASKRSADYLRIRCELEEHVRQLFIAKGGKPIRLRPHYYVLGSCSWLLSWYTQGCELKIPLAEFDSDQISFTYGDTFPAMRVQDGKPYRRQVYVLDELADVIQRYGLPQEWNADGARGPERYIEAQVWSDYAIEKYR
jgi:hypothetical protein